MFKQLKLIKCTVSYTTRKTVIDHWTFVWFQHYMPKNPVPPHVHVTDREAETSLSTTEFPSPTHVSSAVTRSSSLRYSTAHISHTHTHTRDYCWETGQMKRESNQVIFICIALFSVHIVSKQLRRKLYWYIVVILITDSRIRVYFKSLQRATAKLPDIKGPLI